MYFNAETQSLILGRLHFALNPEGLLFLGKAEMLLSHGQLFAPVDLGRRFFRKREAPPGLDRRPVPGVVREPLGVGEGELSRLRREAMLAAPAAQIALDSDGRLAMGKDRKSTRLNSSHANISYAVFCLKKKKKNTV